MFLETSKPNQNQSIVVFYWIWWNIYNFFSIIIIVYGINILSIYTALTTHSQYTRFLCSVGYDRKVERKTSPSRVLCSLFGFGWTKFNHVIPINNNILLLVSNFLVIRHTLYFVNLCLSICRLYCSLTFFTYYLQLLWWNWYTISGLTLQANNYNEHNI